VSQHKHLYNSARWKRTRAAQLAAHPLCRMHLALGATVEATVADHIEPHRGDEALFFGGPLQSLCKPCHDAHKQAQEHNADGVLRGAGLDGRPLDLAHPWHRASIGAGEGGAKVCEASSADRSLPFARMTAKSEGGA
jgi:5-methylcytosine-specific restriction enzyme A